MAFTRHDGALLLLVVLGAGGLTASMRTAVTEAAVCGVGMAEQGSTHVGELVESADDWFTITSDAQERRTYLVGPDTMITLDGNAARLSDLRAGDTLRVTTKERYPSLALIVDGIRHSSKT